MRLLLLSIFIWTISTAEKCENPETLTADNTITIKKTPCFGQCPSYTFTINGLGEATFKGEMFVEKKGKYTKTFNQKQTEGLFKAYQNAGFENFDDAYENEQIMDLPTTTLSLSHNGQTKSIKLYYGYPDELARLAELTQSYAFSEGWEPVEKM